ncbi:MAG: adenylate cyclase, partial [Bacteroidetes bacterium]
MTDKTIAVLPFVNMSSSEDTEYFSDGMTEEIINALAKIHGLKVTSRTSSFFFKNKNIPIGEIGEQLNVATILEGSVRLGGNKMRITAQLIDVAEDFHFWSETFDRPLEDVFAVQDEISLLIADKLREQIGHFDIEEHLVEKPDIPVEVYQKYLKGRYHLMKLDLPGTMKAIEIYKEIIEEQPSFVPPYLEINQGYAFLGTMGKIPAEEAFATAKPYLDKAIELDENYPECQLNLSWTACWQNWNFDAAYKHIDKGIAARPTDQMYLTKANFLTVQGKLEEASIEFEKALQIAPLHPMNVHYKGFLYYLKEEHDEAIPYFKKSLDLQPDLYYPILYWGCSLFLKNQAEQALEFFQNLPEPKPGDLTKMGGEALAYAALGNKSKVQESVKSLEEALQTDTMGRAMNFLILCHTLRGDYEKAMEMIEQALSFRLPLILLMYTEPLLKPLRSNPRFVEIMRDALDLNETVEIPKRKYKQALFDKTGLEKNKLQLEQIMT